MRAQAKQVRHEEEEESAFVSMTDMTVGFLFIMMILLAFFASQMGDPDAVSKRDYDAVVDQRNEWEAVAETRAERIAELEALLVQLHLERAELQDVVADLREHLASKDVRIAELERQLAELRQVDPLEAYLAQVAQARRQVLTRLRDAIRADFPDLQVELSEESDALRFQGEGLFASGRSSLTRDKVDIVSRLAQRLNEVLPCFTLGMASTFDVDCNPGFVMIEAVQIEGHTDNVGTELVNRTLSTSRANSTFFAMTDAAAGVMQHQNLKGQPVLSVAAYGPDRPVTTNDTPEGRSTNRRIDLRFIMVTPQDTDGIAVIREALQAVEGRP
ncbi:OmpA family protein [Loktanella sp. R86503]|uniref:OmpA/MotB family protein n=1 Tax=Loktanella sp. R86503 TaxID=3093847 RepID=UPI0036DB48A4